MEAWYNYTHSNFLREPKFETTTNQAYNVFKGNEGGTEDGGYTTPDTNYMNTVFLSESAECIPSIEDSIYENWTRTGFSLLLLCVYSAGVVFVTNILVVMETLMCATCVGSLRC